MPPTLSSLASMASGAASSLSSAANGFSNAASSFGGSGGSASGGSVDDGQTRLLADFEVRVDGAKLSDAATNDTLEVTVENSLHLPDMCVLRIYDAEFEWIDSELFTIGKTVQINARFEQGAPTTLFNGEIAAIDMDMNAQAVPTFEVRCYDRGHRLHRGRKRRTFVQSTDSDIVTRVAREAGFSVDIDSTSLVHEWVMQNNQTDWEFLQERAARNGYRLYIDNASSPAVLCFKEVNEATPVISCHWGRDLRVFRPRIAVGPQVNEVVVRGWDQKSKQAIVGQVSSAAGGTPEIGLGQSGAQMGQAKFGAAQMVVVDRPVHTQDEAQTLAQSIFDDIAGEFIEADGVVMGDPDLQPETMLNVCGVGTRFSGKYFVTSTTHVYSAQEGYSTLFSVTGKRAGTMLSIFEHDGSGKRSQLGGTIVVGIVTNNLDPDNLGRLKVKYPWFDDTLESHWMRMAVPMGGPSRGFHFLPEINDEVLVAFEHGDVRRPYIIGALWNNVDQPVEGNDVAVTNSVVNHRTIKTRIGHTVLLDDTDGTGEMKMTTKYGHVLTLNDTDKHITAQTKGGHKITLDEPNKHITAQTISGHKVLLDDAGRKIQIVDQTGSNKMTIQSTDNSITIECLGNYTVDAKGKVSIKGLAGVDVTTPAKILVQGLGGVDVNSPAMVNVEGSSMATLKSPGVVVVQGSLVKIN